MSEYGIIALIAAIAVFIIDSSGFTETWKAHLGRWLGIKVGSAKPFDCSLCATFWAGTLYLIIAGRWSIGTQAFVCACALLTRPAASLLGAVRYLLEGIIERLTKLIDKLY